MIHPRHTEVRRAPLKWHVLDVLGQHERSGLEHEDSAAARCIVDEKMLCHDGAKRAAADDDDVEVALSSCDDLACAGKSLLQGIAEETALMIQAEARCLGERVFRSFEQLFDHDGFLPCMSALLRGMSK
ncbi:hypothetical protein [Nitrobacter vulgaris]|uniref:hypothetical protein n=1 Tax=Nitrobacter vulgaris TaxID=29421 RepID=UPI001301D70C|nr:hypothetical protein [Nitrobacter vulgaris]